MWALNKKMSKLVCVRVSMCVRAEGGLLKSQ